MPIEELPGPASNESYRDLMDEGNYLGSISTVQQQVSLSSDPCSTIPNDFTEPASNDSGLELIADDIPWDEFMNEMVNSGF